MDALLPMTSFLLLAMEALRLWYVVPLVACVSLVYAATRHEELGPILVHAVRFAVWVLVFMGVLVGVLQAFEFLR